MVKHGSAAPYTLSRRDALTVAATWTLAPLMASLASACTRSAPSAELQSEPLLGQLSLHALAKREAGVTGTSGLSPLGIGGARDGVVLAPQSLHAGEQLPLLLLLHGATGSGARVMEIMRPYAETSRCIIVAPDSRDVTWDFIRGPFGPDIEFIGHAIDTVTARYDVDRARMSVAGFSDGASYALSVGLSNGDLFPRIAAFSPGLLGVLKARGHPALFISHGTRDQVLNIDRCSRRIVPTLRGQGYTVSYQEFDGPHTVPPDIARTALSWLTAPGTTTPA